MTHKEMLLYLTSILLIAYGCSPARVQNARCIDSRPPIYPDYSGTTLPINIAPLEFGMEEELYNAMDVLFTNKGGDTLRAFGNPSLSIPKKEWSALLRESANDSILVIVRARQAEQWLQFQPFSLFIAPDSIDYSIVYRLIAPGYQTYSKMGIYQRTLSDFTQSTLYENTQVTKSCVNCHTFCQGDPEIQSVHFRGKQGATLLVKEGEMQAYNTRTDSTLATAAYPSWHPSGRYIAYSTNIIRQMFHTTPENLIESFDMDSDLYIYDTHTNEIIYNPLLKHADYFETHPAFSADGKLLYFCRAARREMPQEVNEVRYDLCSVNFDPDTGTLGNKIDTLYLASSEGKSISFPRPTSDGKYLVYTETNSGCFPLYHQEADLGILDLESRERRMMEEINSPHADAFHNFSSNNRWLVFGSRREDGMHTRLYFSYIDPKGVGRKPFLLPQSNPKTYYSDLMLSYNCAEFVKGKVHFDARRVATRLYSTQKKRMQVREMK
ncbi:MAG: TolB family protein [Phocaeicola sp.]